MGAMLLVLVLPFTHAIAPRINGSRRWLQLGVSIQVSELAKLAIIIWTAMLCAKKGTEVRRLRRGDSIAPEALPDAVFVAVGGGGLIGGIASWYHSRVKVVGVEPG